MRITPDTIGLRLLGEGIDPKKLTGRELSKLIISLEDALLATVREQSPDVKEEDVYISLVDVVESSAGFRFIPNSIDIVVAAYLTITSAINSQNYENLPVNSIQSLQPIIEFTNERQCKAEFRLGNDLLATIEPVNREEVIVKDQIEQGSRFLYGKTTIYALVQRAGGYKPRVTLRINETEPLLSIETTTEEAKKLAERLYDTVGLSGTATWESKTLRLLNFKIEEILDYEEVSIKDSFEEVSGALGKYWNNIDNVKEFLY